MNDPAAAGQADCQRRADARFGAGDVFERSEFRKKAYLRADVFAENGTPERLYPPKPEC